MKRHGYEYDIKRQNNDKSILWRCAKMKTCSATIKTNSDFNVIMKETSHSNKLLNITEVEIKMQMEKFSKADLKNS